MERTSQRRIRKVAASLVLLMAIGLLQDRVRLLHDGINSLQWPTVTGTILEAEATRIAGAQAGPGWQVRVRYQYQVDDQEYSADRLRFSRQLGGRTQVQAGDELLPYVLGGPILVYYDPNRPGRSVIVPGPDPRAWFGLSVGVLMLMIAGVFWTVPTRVSGRPGKA